MYPDNAFILVYFDWDYSACGQLRLKNIQLTNVDLKLLVLIFILKRENHQKGGGLWYLMPLSIITMYFTPSYLIKL